MEAAQGADICGARTPELSEVIQHNHSAIKLALDDAIIFYSCRQKKAAALRMTCLGSRAENSLTHKRLQGITASARSGG